MKKYLLFAAISCLIASKTSFSQSTNCADAVVQLQNYASQINQLYNSEYWNVIPNVRCPAYDQWGRPFNPVIVQNCRLQTLAYLNNWYGQQCLYVNNWYAQIARGCAVKTPTTIKKPAPGRVSGSDQSEEIDTDEIEDLAVGIDEEKAVRITIPKTAAGFKGRQ